MTRTPVVEKKLNKKSFGSKGCTGLFRIGGKPWMNRTERFSWEVSEISQRLIGADHWIFVLVCRARENEHLDTSQDYSNRIGQGDEEYNAMERAFWNNDNAYVPVFVPTPNSSYLAINAEWFSEYVADELGKLHDWYIPEFSKEYRAIDKIHLRCNFRNGEETVCPELASQQPVAKPIINKKLINCAGYLLCTLRLKAKWSFLSINEYVLIVSVKCLKFWTWRWDEGSIWTSIGCPWQCLYYIYVSQRGKGVHNLLFSLQKNLWSLDYDRKDSVERLILEKN